MQTSSTIALISVNHDPARETDTQNVYVRSIGQALSRLGWQVDMFTRRTEPTQADIVQHNPLCRTIRLTAGLEQAVPQQKIIGYLPEFLKQLRQFQLENEQEYRLIHTNSWLSAWVGIELKKTQLLRHVHTFHTLGAAKYSQNDELKPLAKTRLGIEKVCLETADLCIATCPQQRDYLRELVSENGGVEIIPSGTDHNLFGSISYAQARKKLAIPSDIFHLLYVGKFNHVSGIKNLLQAVSKPSLHREANIRLTLINNSPQVKPIKHKQIEQLAWELGLDNITTVLKEQTPLDLATHYAAADVCIAPSLYNPSGMTALNAMASGTAVIAANTGGLKYAIEHQVSGLLFPPRNSFLLAKAIGRLIEEPKLRSQLAQSARERVEQLFTWDIVASQLNEFYIEQLTQQNLALLHNSWHSSLRVIGA